ncbi:MAG TPA: nuclear transport factor 2 family protein [Alphaproteobacteria bacterium]|nr:nuclear transport factor 2 family protein [Alphaproteobacteria bacterium]
MQNKRSSKKAKSEKPKQNAVEIVNRILQNPKDIENVRSLTAKDVTYVSLNYSNPDLKKIMPWCGTSDGPESIVKTFVDVGRFWKVKSFEKEATFSDGENVAIFGRFTYLSTVLSRTVTSPFAVFAKVRNGRCTYLQFMEDTFATGASFRSGGQWTFHSDPDGTEVTI